MRKSIVLYIGAMLVILLLSTIFTFVGGNETILRYHQHQEQPGEDRLEPCRACGGLLKLCTHLPIICIETGGQKVPGRAITNKEGLPISFELGDNGEEEISVWLSFIDKKGVWHHPNDMPTHKSQALFRVRGNSSRQFDKSSYRVKLTTSDKLEYKLPLLGMTNGSEWALHGPFLDKTLMRNYVWMNLSAEIMGYAPNVRFCELMLDGQYMGVYVLMETISVQEGRVNVTKYRDGDPVHSYLVRMDSYVNPQKRIDVFNTYTHRLEQGSNFEVLYPGTSHQNEKVHGFIKADISEIEKSLYSLEIFRGAGTYKNAIDVDSFVDYYILQEFLAVNDAFSRSTYFYRDVRGKLTAGPVWDYNNALDNFFAPMPVDEFILSQRGWYGQLMMDEKFVDKVIRRYRSLRRGILSEQCLLEYNEDVRNWLGSAVARNFEVWGYTFDIKWLSQIGNVRKTPARGSENTIRDLNPTDYDDAMDKMLEYLRRRGQWLDRNIESLRQYCHPSRNALWSEE